MKYLSAKDAGLVACSACGRLSREVKTLEKERCPRCGAVLHQRKVDSLARTWALLIAAAILYIPANLLPMMQTRSLLGNSSDTIMSGVIYFWTSGEYDLAIVVFTASILVPMLKLIALSLLCFTAQRGTGWKPHQRTKLYHMIEFIGRWSMLDVFVVALMVALVNIQSLAVIQAGPGIVAFGSVVVLTMLASMQFDPRLIWDQIRDDDTEQDDHD
ncbi:paraquat-inducible protein A [Pandoraea apista]|uniref:Paraquat-inducible protein A n=1 Tax=Pandoraea apista TaxID=93218 RepID=A0ABX9ZI40_9BURK|nr:paraquat-inducible protein A [Pandoraea apista]AJE99253.1 paraquat-inducible protein A [Pandoraea apista]AKH73362.1 paraquat-inducible protein A [Pandoraea apista]AKI61908.1 paraquat-inducible protein A [Pandoraea apista]AVF40174.1 paraquat-inducible protein A [Pandoraea apista]PTE02665.1 paraquat-inducible protein A [Pandoraea apista]